MKCPKCGETVDLSKIECSKCGVIYAKAFAKLAGEKELPEAPKDHIQEEHQPKNIKSWKNILSPIRVGIPLILVVLLTSGLVIKFNKKPDISSNNISSDTTKTSTNKSSNVVVTSNTSGNPEISSNGNSQAKELDNLSETTKEKLKACSGCVSGDHKMVKDQDGCIYVTNIGDCITSCEAAIESHRMLNEEVGRYFKLSKKEFELFGNNYKNTFDKAQDVSSGMMVAFDMDALVTFISATEGEKLKEKLRGTNDKRESEKIIEYFSQIARLSNLSDKILEQNSEALKQQLKDLEVMK
jgi:hypothetical protein